MDIVKAESQRMKQRMDILEDEKKEYEMTINELKDEIKELKKKTLDINNYKDWDSDDVINWILSIEDGAFIKYEEKIKQEVIEGEIEGGDLITMDMDDIKRLGITKFAHKKLLQTSIQKLRQIDGNKQMVNNDNEANEGVNPPTAYL